MCLCDVIVARQHVLYTRNVNNSSVRSLEGGACIKCNSAGANGGA